MIKDFFYKDKEGGYVLPSLNLLPKVHKLSEN